MSGPYCSRPLAMIGRWESGEWQKRKVFLRMRVVLFSPLGLYCPRRRWWCSLCSYAIGGQRYYYYLSHVVYTDDVRVWVCGYVGRNSAPDPRNELTLRTITDHKRLYYTIILFIRYILFRSIGDFTMFFV